MFFHGSVQEGISTAVGQQKLLLCFVTDDNEESQTWENDFLQDDSINDQIASKAIALRLKAGSDEAGYLAQIFPLPKTPTVVIMKHGELKEYIASGTTKEDFLRRLSNAFSAGNAAASSAAPSTPTAAAAPAAVPTPGAEASAPSPSALPSGSPESDGSENVRRIVAERAARAQRETAAQQAREAATAAAAATAASKGKGKAAPDSSAPPAQTEAQKEAAELIKKKKAQQNDERRRILKRIEDDKIARRELAAHREKQRLDDRAALESETKEQQPARAASRVSSSTGSVAAIQVRLSDGSTLRNKFQATESVKDIRSWVDKERTDGSGPYYFKQILTPLPNKNIDTTEEGKALRELGLSPSSTLLLIPIQRFAAAYDGQGDSSPGFFSQILGLIFGVFTWLMGIIGLGGEAPPAEAHPSSQPAANAPAALRNQRVRAFENPNDRRGDQQLYNGNSLNFEPRPDEDEK